MRTRVLHRLLFALPGLFAALGCEHQTSSPEPALQPPADVLWVGPLSARWIVERGVRGLPVPIYPASGFAAPVCLTLDGTVVVSPAADSFECGGYYPLTELIEAQLLELPLPPPSFRDLQRYAALSGASLWLWTWRVEDYQPLFAANRQTRWSLPDNWPSDRTSRRNPAISAGPASQPAEPYQPIVSARLPIMPGIPAESLPALAAWFESARATPRKYLSNDPLAGAPYADLPPLAPSPYIYPLKVSRQGRLPGEALPLQDRLSLPDPVGRLVAFSTIAVEGRQSGTKYNELYAVAMASNVGPVARSNAILAIGTIPDSRQATLLIAALRERETRIAEAAAYMIGLSNLPNAKGDLETARKTRPELGDVTAWALARLHSPNLKTELLDKLLAGSAAVPPAASSPLAPTVREGSAETSTPRAVAPMIPDCPLSAHELLAVGSLLTSSEPSDQRTSAAIQTLAALAGNHPDPAVRRPAALALARIPQPQAAEELGRLLERNLIEPAELPAAITRLTNAGEPGIRMLLSAWVEGSPVTRAAVSLGLQFAGELAAAVLADQIRAPETPLALRQAAILFVCRRPKSPAALAALQAVPPAFRPQAAVVLTLWNEPLPADWPPDAGRALLPAEVARQRMTEVLTTQPASTPTAR